MSVSSSASRAMKKSPVITDVASRPSSRTPTSTAQAVEPERGSDGEAATAPARGRHVTAEVWLLLGALALWAWSLIGVDLEAMTGVGLLSVMPPMFYQSLAVLTVGFVLVVYRQPGRRPLAAAYLTTLAVIVHGTPAILYRTLRYSWSWKHVGIVDFIQRNGELDPDARFLDIYHGWPGVFGLTALVSDATGIDALTLAMWAPVAFTLVSLLALSVLFRAFVDDQRIVWTAMWLYVLGNWVGQEYFSPQGFTFTLYLALLAISLPLERSRQHAAGKAAILRGIGPVATAGRERVAIIALLLLLVVAIVGSHQLTPMMVITTFGVAAALRRSRTAWIAVAAAAMTLTWMAGPAWSYVRRNALDAVDTLGSPTTSSSSSLLDTTEVSLGQAVVVIADRFLVLAVLALAVVGLVVRRRRGHSVTLIAALVAAPAVLLVTDYGGEALFRSYLFAVPWLALSGAFAVIHLTERFRSPIGEVARGTVFVVLTAAFLLSYLGKERMNYFTTDEVDLTAWLYETAPENTLLIEGSRNYPGSARNYENFFYVAIAREPDESQATIQADPEGTMFRWMSNERYSAAYLVITDAQKRAEDSVPSMPPGLLDEIETALRASSRFEIARSNDDGVIFVLADSEQDDDS